MELYNSYAEVWPQTEDVDDHVARCARVCYASSKVTCNKQLCKSLWKSKHYSMFRHAGVYYIIPEKLQLPEKAYIAAIVKLVGTNYYVSTNEQAAREYWDKRYSKYRISLKDAFVDDVFKENKMLRVTVAIDTGIDISREFNRKSPNNISEQSTRYVNFNTKLGVNFKRCWWMDYCNFYKKMLYTFMLKCSEWFYKIASHKYGLALSPEDARFILPLDTLTRVVYTYTIAEWEYIINVRLWDYTGRAHNDAKRVASSIKHALNNAGFKIEQYNKNEFYSHLV